MTARETPPAGKDAPDRRFPASERIQRRYDYRRVFDQGSVHHGSRLVLFLLEDPAASRQIGIVAGRKAGKAVQRNRAKRLLREAYRHVRSRLPDRGIHLVLVARRGCSEASAVEIQRELALLLSRAGFPVG